MSRAPGVPADRRPLVAIFGPTASGKTALAAGVADAIPAHLVSCDAVQVYRGLDAATAKPDGDELRHAWALVDCLDPRADADLGWWVRAAERELDRAHAAGRVPIVVGGTGMYLRGLLKGVGPAPPRDAPTRRRIEALAERRGLAILHRILGRLDPEGAAAIMAADRQRIVRALEVRVLTGRPLSGHHAWRWRGPDRLPVLRIALRLPRDELYRRIDARVELFFERGLVDEVRRLLAAGVPPGANAFKAIGYREVVAALRAERPVRPQELIEDVQRETRHYAKRQETWFRRETGAIEIDALAADREARAVAAISAFLARERA